MPLALAVARLGVARLLRSLCLGRDAPGYEYVQLSSCGPLPFSPPQGEQLAWCEVFVERHRLAGETVAAARRCRPRLRSESDPLLSISTKSGLSRVSMRTQVLVRQSKFPMLIA